MSWAWRLCWKDLREQSTFVVALVLLAVLGMVGVAMIFPGTGASATLADEMGRALGTATILIVAVSQAAVGSALLFAGEHENGLQTYLDSLPVTRRRLWLVKALFGLVLTLGLTLFLFVLGEFFGIAREDQREATPAWIWLVGLVSIAVWAYAWGLCASALSRSVLGSAGLTALFLLVSCSVASLFGFVSLAFIYVVWALLTVGAVVVARHVYCRPDRLRTARGTARLKGLARPASVPALLWLAWRQGRLFQAILFVAVIPLGILCHWYGVWLWPTATLLIGLLCGIAAFGGDQLGGARFLGQQRLPPGRVWSVKTLYWLFTAVAGATLLLLVGTVTHIVEQISRTGSLLQWQQNWLPLPRYAALLGPGIPLLWLATLWTAYGFSAGLLAAQLFRKPIIALVIALFGSSSLVGLWLPSLVVGGLYAWQIYLIPVILVLVSWLVMWPWTADYLVSRRWLLGLTACAVVVVVWMAGNLWYRAAEIPDLGEAFDQKAYQSSLTQEGGNARSWLRQALVALPDQEAAVREQLRASGRGYPEDEKPRDKNVRSRSPYREKLDKVLRGEWPQDDPPLARWLVLMFEGEWIAELQKMRGQPLGVLVYPQEVKWHRRIDYHELAQFAGKLFCCRARQRLAAGRTDQALKDLELVLILANQVRNKAPFSGYHTGNQIEDDALLTLRDWLTAAKDQPKLLRRLARTLAEQEQSLPALADSAKSEYLAGQAARQDLYFSPQTRPEFKVQSFLVAAPWEQERIARIDHAILASQLWLLEQPLWKLPSPRSTTSNGWGRSREITIIDNLDRPRHFSVVNNLGPDTPGNPGDVLSAERWWEIARTAPPGLFWWTDALANYRAWAEELYRLRVMRQQTAAALYQAEHQRPARSFDDLVPRYLPAVPVDPRTGQPFPTLVQWE